MIQNVSSPVPYVDNYDKIIYISDSGSDTNDGKTKGNPLRTIKRFKTLYGQGKYRLYIVGTLTISTDCTLDVSYFQGISASELGTLVIESGKHIRFTSNVMINHLIIKNNDVYSNYCIRGVSCIYMYNVTFSGNLGIQMNGIITISLIHYGSSDRVNFGNSIINIYGQSAQGGDVVNTVSWLAHMDHCIIFAGASLKFPNVNGKYTYLRWAD